MEAVGRTWRDLQMSLSTTLSRIPFFYRLIFVAVACALLLLPVTRLGFFQSLENRTLDLRFKAQPTPSDSSIVIVTVDGGSLERLPWLSWPWPRQLYGDCLGLLRRWGASVVAFDILYDLPSLYGAGDDQALGDSAGAFGRAVFAINLQRRDGRPIPESAVIPVSGAFPGLDSAWTSTPPFDPILAGAAALGNVSAQPDADGVFRRIGLLTNTPAGPVPSLALAVAWLHAGRPDMALEPGLLSIGNARIPLDEDYRMILRFRGPTATFRYVPIADLLQSIEAEAAGTEGPVDPAVFRNAIVFIGYTAPGLYDLKPTPYSAICPGVEVHANTVDNILAGVAIRRVGVPATFVCALLCSLLCAIAFRAGKSVVLQGLLGVAVLAGYSGAAFLAFASNVWIETVYPLSAGLVSLLAGSIMSYGRANRQKREIRAAFSQYLSPAVVEQLSRHPEKLVLGGEQKVMTAYFSDLAGFTSFSEKLTPSELVGLLNRYLSMMTDTILEHGGTLDKYIGDAIVAFWNAPLPCEDHAAAACRTILSMKDSLVALNATLLSEGLPELKPRTGLNTGLMTVGNMGSSRRFDYTMMGSSVNLASRLEGVNKVYGTWIMASRATVEAAGEEFIFRELDTIRVVGQKTPVDIFELLGYRESVPVEAARLASSYAEALAAYREGSFDRALGMFEALAAGGDPVSGAMAGRCADLSARGRIDGWDGVYDMTSK